MTIIESLDQEGRGVAHAEGKVIFIEGALPGETVTYSTFKKKPSYELATCNENPQAQLACASRRTARISACAAAAACSTWMPRAQVAVKQRVLEDNLWHIGKVRAEEILPPIYGQAWGYRHRARLSVALCRKKGAFWSAFTKSAAALSPT